MTLGDKLNKYACDLNYLKVIECVPYISQFDIMDTLIQADEQYDKERTYPVFIKRGSSYKSIPSYSEEREYRGY